MVPISPDVDPKAGKADPAVALGGKPEFLVAAEGKAYVNLVDKNQVAVVDTKTMKVIDKWSTAPGGSPVGMAMDVARHRLFVGCRKPQKLIVMSAESGKVLADLPIGAGVDATQFDGDAFASCRDGTLAVARETSPGKFAIVQTLQTRPGARTMGLDPTDAHALPSHGPVQREERPPVAAHPQARLVHDRGGWAVEQLGRPAFHVPAGRVPAGTRLSVFVAPTARNRRR